MKGLRLTLAVLGTVLVVSAVGASSASACSWQGAVAGQGTWAYSSGCGVIGMTASTRVGYSWATQPGTNTRICVQARGYVPFIGPIAPGTTRPLVAQWYSMGCGTSGSGTVPWGNTASVKKVRAQVQLGFLGGLYRWG